MRNTKGIQEHKFKKGQSGNPKGRPKKLPQLDTLLDRVLGEAKGDITEAERILQALKRRALKGDVRAAEIILDRAYGKPKQSVDVRSKVEIVDELVFE